MPSDKPASGRDNFTLPANAATAGSYTADGSWNIGGWATYPSKDELAISTKRPKLVPQGKRSK